ncbi:hypothetical protein AVEN_221073-1 [Araneus ventricosus]|uniref:Uncharacterized protein n=1 Tax=Araneus ventricosus TaxID=182803 RepID=A0A4Y2QYU7_ARAVE|nr:hypothetical protein AVEN_221073-1 [Araneus ventricosus]
MIPIKFINSVERVIEYGFIVQKSVTHLDLSLGEFSGFKRKIQKRNNMFASNLNSRRAAEKNAVLTEEACRKRSAPDRKLLYDFHLDVSKELELSLRSASNQDIRPCYSSSVLINKIVFETHKYEIFFNRMLSEVLKKINQKVKFIHQISKMAKCMKFILKNKYIRDEGLNVLYFQDADSTVVVDFLTTMNFIDGHFFSLFMDVFEFVLYKTNQARYNLWTLPQCEMINASIYYRLFMRTEALLQYRDGPRFCNKLYDKLKRSIIG